MMGGDLLVSGGRDREGEKMATSLLKGPGKWGIKVIIRSRGISEGKRERA